jgi:Ca2+-dependent lipid-binding protein
MSDKHKKKSSSADRKSSSADKKSSSSDKKKKPPAITYTINVRVISASNLLPADRNGTSDPYVVFQLNGSKDKIYTPFVENSLNPEWNADIQIPSTGSPATDQLKIEVYDKDKHVDLAKNDHIGLIETFWINELPRQPNTPKEVVLQLVKTDKKGKVKGSPVPGEAGSLKLQFVLVPAEGAPPFPEVVYRALIEFQSAAGLPSGDVDGNSDPFLEAKLAHSENAQKFKTRVIKNTRNPEWKEQATFFFGSLEKDALEITILDKDEVGDSDKLAKALISLKEFPVGPELVAKTFELASAEKKGKAAGTLTLLGKIAIVTIEE